MNRTLIEWCRNPDGSPGFTWNPLTGCLGPDGKNPCSYCYARKLANGRLRQRYLANTNSAPQCQGLKPRCDDDPFYPRFWEERLAELDGLHGTGMKPRGVFVCDMGELFGPWLSTEWQAEIFRVIRLNPWHRYYLLTKQPQNLVPWSPFPESCWVGVTATDMEQYKAALVGLAVVEAEVKYISFEPLLEHIPIGRSYDFGKDIGWLIIGAQTKPYKPPKLEWVEEIVMAADEAGVKVFLKNNLAPALKVREPFIETSKNYTRYPRQEMPEPKPGRKALSVGVRRGV